MIREGTVPLTEWISDWEGTPEKEKSCLQCFPESMETGIPDPRVSFTADVAIA
jgi:hypothetical protein